MGARGLTTAQAAERRARHGANELPRVRRRSPVGKLLAQLTHFFALMLWAAAGLAWFAQLPQLSIAITAVIIINAVFAFIQEERADRAADRLRTLLPADVTVVRDGRPITVAARDVVLGDLLMLTAGDRIPADATTTRSSQMRVDTSTLTGESRPRRVDVDGELFAGTFVVEGDGEATVTATGAATRLAAISTMTAQTPHPITPLTVELRRVVRIIAMIALGVGAIFFAVTWLLGNAWSQALVFAVGVTVALVPEALLPTVTLTLAWGAERMAKRNVLVRDLEAVETLGSTTFICTDKTGTLTVNQMTVVEGWTPLALARTATAGYDPDAAVEVEGAAEQIQALAVAAVQSSDGYVTRVDGAWVPHGDPMEAAFDTFARRLGVDTERERRSVTHRFPFDHRRRRMSVVIDGAVLCKGAPDSVLPLCGVGEPEIIAAWTHRGLRVLAVAHATVTGPPPDTAGEAERHLELLGLLALQDPPRPEVREALDACRTAGITVAMVTGDHPATAAAIAQQVGLAPDAPTVLVGPDLPDDLATLGALIDRPGVVVAQVSPEDKFRIAQALRARGHVVAMTGDGVNDVPALHAADIGIAMGRSGTDVAREAADLVLLDDHFNSIVAGIEQGRATYMNMRRFLTYHLTDNVAELTPFVVWALSGGNFPLALGVLQILALDIGTDTLSAVALGAEPPSRHLLNGPPVGGHLLNGTVLRRAFMVLGPAEALMSMTAFVMTFVAVGWRPGDAFPGGQIALAASGAAFMSVVLAQAANAFACRSSTRWPGSLGWASNRLLIPAVGIGLVFAFAVLWVPALAQALGQSNPTPVGWALAIMSIAVLLGVDVVEKSLRRRLRAPVRPR